MTAADAGPDAPFTQCMVARSKPPECICTKLVSYASNTKQETSTSKHLKAQEEEEVTYDMASSKA